MSAVGVIRRAAVLFRGDDFRELLGVVLGEAVGRGLRGGRLEVVEVAVALLIIREAVAHVLQDIHGKLMTLTAGDVAGHPGRVLDGFVHADDTDGREVVREGPQVTSGVGIQSLVHEARDDLTLDAQGSGRDVHVAVEHGVELIGILCDVGHAGKVQGHNADGAGALT